MNSGTISVAAPKAASSGTARYSLLALNAFLPVRIGLHQTGINRKAFSANQILVDIAAQGDKQPTQQITVVTVVTSSLSAGLASRP
jgi:hypothetical protein